MDKSGRRTASNSTLSLLVLPAAVESTSKDHLAPSKAPLRQDSFYGARQCLDVTGWAVDKLGMYGVRNLKLLTGDVNKCKGHLQMGE